MTVAPLCFIGLALGCARYCKNKNANTNERAPGTVASLTNGVDAAAQRIELVIKIVILKIGSPDFPQVCVRCRQLLGRGESGGFYEPTVFAR